jgi:beta-fructofuranosidase
MMLNPTHWTWDFWTARDGADYHLFFLKAPRSLGDPDLRHENARVGHAVSTDLRTWTELPDALEPGPEGAWDDLATWTGSVLRDPQGTWHMFYTGINRRERGAHQRIGHAVSDDLRTWTKTAEPVLQLADDQDGHYQGAVTDWPAVDWRDPWVYRSDAHGEYRMLFTARVPGGASDERGAIGQARSQDLVTWEPLEPLVAPGEFGHMEVPQLFREGDRWYLSYSVYAEQHSARRRALTSAQTGTHYFVADAETGPFRSPGDEFLCGDPHGELYAGRFERDPDGNLVFLAFLQFVDGGEFIGGLSDPIPVDVDHDGHLTLDRAAVGDLVPEPAA